MKDYNETAKAVTEVAKTTGQVVKASEKLGKFISKYIGGSLEQCMGIIEDKLKYMRWENQVKLIKKVENSIIELGLEVPSRTIPMKLAIPLLQAASMEDDDYLQDKWAILLINAANKESIEIKRIYIDLLERLSPLEAKILDEIHKLPFNEIKHNGVRTEYLPVKAIAGPNSDTTEDWKEPSPEIESALISLTYIGCISPEKSMGGGEFFKRVTPTLLGKYFVEACKIDKIKGIS